MTDDDYEAVEMEIMAEMEIEGLKEQVFHLQAQLAQRDAAINAADKLAATVDVIRCSDEELRALQAYRQARGQDAD